MGLSVDDWTLVVRNNNKGRRLKTFTGTSKCKAIVNSSKHFDNEFDLPLRIAKIRNDFPENFKQFVISRLEKALYGNNLSVIRIFGIGSISNSYDSRWQLALLLYIKEHFSVDLVTSQDPITSDLENRYLQSCGIKVLKPDDLKSTPPSTPFNSFTLLYMIHCDYYMYENVLSCYFNKTNNYFQKIILIGNEPEGYKLNSKFQIPHLIRFAALSSVVNFPYFSPSKTAFNETAIYIKLDEEMI